MLLARSVFFYPVSVVLPTVAVSGTHTCSRGAGLKRFSTISRRADTDSHALAAGSKRAGTPREFPQLDGTSICAELALIDLI